MKRRKEKPQELIEFQAEQPPTPPWRGALGERPTVPIELTVLGVPMVHASMLERTQKRLDAMTERNRQLVAGGALQRRRQAESDLNEALDLLEGVNRTGAFDRFLESHNRVIITSGGVST